MLYKIIGALVFSAFFFGILLLPKQFIAERGYEALSVNIKEMHPLTAINSWMELS